MEITLEKIEIVKDRTGVTYKEAKEALEHNDGSVVDAIIEIEELINIEGDGKEEDVKAKIFNKIKNTAEKGNMSRIIVKRGDEILLNLPLTVGVLGAVIAPWGVIFGTIAAFGGAEYVFMADIWNPKQLSDSRHLWLPIRFEEGKPVIQK